jgi:hypothetical protein
MSRRYREQSYHPDRALAIPTLSEAMSLCSILENGHAYAALSSTQRRLVTNRGWVAKPPTRAERRYVVTNEGVTTAPKPTWQVSAAGIEALRRVDVGARAIQTRLDILHQLALFDEAEREDKRESEEDE